MTCKASPQYKAHVLFMSAILGPYTVCWSLSSGVQPQPWHWRPASMALSAALAMAIPPVGPEPKDPGRAELFHFFWKPSPTPNYAE